MVPSEKQKGLVLPEQFGVHCYLFKFRLSSPTTLPVYKGDVFHRALGRGLALISPRFGRYFFKPQKPEQWPDSHQTPPSPFMLLPPATGQTRFQPGETLEVGFTLFGGAHMHLMTLFAALEKLGADEGLDKGKGKFRIERLLQITTDQPIELFADDRWHQMPAPVSAADIFAAAPSSASRITLRMLTRLRLKDQGKLVRNNLPLPIVMDRLIGRINTLAAMYCGGPMLPPEEKTALVTLARTARISHDNTRWSDWGRDHSKNSMKFGGLTGDITYENIPSVLLPWLSLGQWIAVGGKSSFGLGLYEITATREVLSL